MEPGEAVGQDEQAASWVELQGVKVSKGEQDVMAVHVWQAVLPWLGANVLGGQPVHDSCA